MTIVPSAAPVGARLADQHQDVLIAAIAKNMEALQSGNTAMVALGAVALWGMLQRTEKIGLMGFEAKRRDAFAVLASIIGVQQLSMALHLLYIQYDLALIDRTHLGAAVATIRYFPWIANPFVKHENLAVLPYLPDISLLLFFGCLIFPMFLAAALWRSNGRAPIARLAILLLYTATWLPIFGAATETARRLNAVDSWPYVSVARGELADIVPALLVVIVVGARLFGGFLHKRIEVADKPDQ